ncbi:peptidyl-prolyl cis-trans isomerase [Jannaschia sp. Os4]|uniref:peptidylprolyl isomerase n=1 Tax=Jannaschia sp. Os4 TaxID=2807617 RepID=UPI0019392B4C|nr:peptidylprolyl isomerase [Jannaschia sp. Os4]MBM2575183.1 peptidyl-prolyl cis-trans isomerase [Jannaschia sp. Os4]
MTRLLTTAALLLASAAPSMAQDVDADTVLATVNGTDITLGHVIAMRSRLPEQFQQIPDEQLYDGVVQQLIQQQALADAQLAEGRRIDALGIENERRAYLAGQAIDAAAGGELDDAAVQAAYEARIEGFEPATEYNASHILVETEEEAAELVALLEDGADFAELAQERSTGPSGPNGGDLGWFQAGMMVPPFQEAVEALEVGGVSAPVQTQFGWHVVKLDDTRETTPPPLEQLYPEIAQEVQQALVADAIAAATEAAEVETFEVEVDPAVIRRTDLLE